MGVSAFKLLLFVNDSALEYSRMLVSGKTFQPSLIFVDASTMNVGHRFCFLHMTNKLERLSLGRIFSPVK